MMIPFTKNLEKDNFNNHQTRNDVDLKTGIILTSIIPSTPKKDLYFNNKRSILQKEY